MRKARREPLTRLADDIAQFTELHRSNTKITRNACKWNIGGRFRQRREEASSIHNVLAYDWRCDCTSVHNVYLQHSLLDTIGLDNDPKKRFLVFGCPTQSNNTNAASSLCQKTTLTVTEVQTNAACTGVAPAPKAQVDDSRSPKPSPLKKFARVVSRERDR